MNAGARFACACVLALASCSAGRAALAASPPDWSKQVLTAVPAWASAEAAVVLLDAEDVTVSPGGRVTHVLRGAVRVHDRLGAREAVAAAVFAGAGSKLSRARGWLTGADGRTDALPKEQVVTRALYANCAMYADAQRVLVAPADAPAGSTFWWEIEYEEPALLAHWRASFAARVPVLEARFSLSLPAGLEATGRIFGTAPVETTRDGATWYWRARELKPRPAEAFALRTDDDWPGVRVSVVASEGSRTAAGVVLPTWPAVSRWLAALSEPQSAPTPALSARAGELANANGDTLATLRSIARAVARMPYVSRDLSLARGLGFRPHAAANVLAAGSGDCKDKANLALALARAVGIDGVLLAVHSGGAARADTADANPGRFDHCIVAFRTGAAAGLPAAFRHPALGMLVAFDATDAATPLGELHSSLQGAPALIETAGGEGLVALPVAPARHDALDQQVRATLTPQGVLEADWRIEYRGSEAAAARGAGLPTDARLLRALLEHRLGALGAATLDDITCTDDSAANVVRVRARARITGFAQRVDDSTLVVRMAFAPMGEALTAPGSEATQALRLPRLHHVESFTLTLPDGYAPRGLSATPPVANTCGEASRSVDASGRELRAARSLTLEPVTLPADRGAEFAALAREWKAAERTAVLLVRR